MKSLKFRRRLLAAVLSGATCLSLFLSGCTGERDTRPVWVLATASPEDTVTQLFAERFAQEVEELSGGEILIKVYPNSTLGGDRELLGWGYPLPGTEHRPAGHLHVRPGRV